MMRKLFNDILKDTGNNKFSMTKFTSLLVMGVFMLYSLGAIYSLFLKNEVDHFFLAELIGFILFLLGFKNVRLSSVKRPENDTTEN